MKKSSKRPARRATKPAAKKRGTTTEAPAKEVAPGKARTPKSPQERDPRLPKPGTVLQRTWHGKTYEVTVNESDFIFKGRAYRSLSGLAREITGARSINGIAWFGLAERPAAKAKGPKKAKASEAPAATETSATTTGEAK
jgi:hypothetical protein